MSVIVQSEKSPRPLDLDILPMYGPVHVYGCAFSKRKDGLKPIMARFGFVQQVPSIDIRSAAGITCVADRMREK